MEEIFVRASEYAILVVDVAALAIVAFGVIEAAVRLCRLPFSREVDTRRREIWLGLMRWLVAAMTFQLAADIIETSITSSWDAIGRIAAIAAVRTFLNFFLERDLDSARERVERGAQ